MNSLLESGEVVAASTYAFSVRDLPTLAFFIAGFASWITARFRPVHRWLVRRGRKNAPDIDIQEAQFREVLDGTQVAVVDPRKFTISVARMNQIAGEYGYHYIGEHGNGFGSTRVAFQVLSGPMPPRFPTTSGRWKKVDPDTPPLGPSPYYFPPLQSSASGSTLTSVYRPVPPEVAAVFDGRDLAHVVVSQPLPDFVPLVDLAYRRGYVFAWTQVLIRRHRMRPPAKVFFRRLYPPP